MPNGILSKDQSTSGVLSTEQVMTPEQRLYLIGLLKNLASKSINYMPNADDARMIQGTNQVFGRFPEDKYRAWQHTQNMIDQEIEGIRGILSGK